MQNVQKVQAAKQELFMEILCEDKNIKKKLLMYVQRKPFHPFDNQCERILAYLVNFSF